ncbi:hypothetical protein IEO21_10211 [Rhodonia placenta]|uniref:Uncharacterized protein n=1 Tax=Rhodonia placenta TaxID=104341 RepID=A0A8H7NT92_9APHY|nr:hypothetical protein IEO21_10211 [Postia placenta]
MLPALARKTSSLAIPGSSSKTPR